MGSLVDLVFTLLLKGPQSNQKDIRYPSKTLSSGQSVLQSFLGKEILRELSNQYGIE